MAYILIETLIETHRPTYAVAVITCKYKVKTNNNLTLCCLQACVLNGLKWPKNIAVHVVLLPNG